MINDEKLLNKENELESEKEKNEDTNDRNKGIMQVVEAARAGDAGAKFYLAEMLISGFVKTNNTPDFNLDEHITALLWESAMSGYVPARIELAKLCNDRSEEYQKQIPIKEGALTDFDGKRIVINRKGLLTPVDAVLTYENNRNILTFTLDLCLVKDKDEDYEKIYKAVCNGIKEWEGEYRVFGGQQLEIKINIEDKDNVFDTVYVLPLTASNSDMLLDIIKNMNVSDNLKEKAANIYGTYRSYAGLGLKWTATSRKAIVIQTGEDGFNDVNEIQRIACHEFGHILGLGDMYASETDGLEGIEKGTYKELDGYYISNNMYHLVMSDCYGPVSNNDIEMVVLAFSENAMQLFQKTKIKGKISKALGRGN